MSASPQRPILSGPVTSTSVPQLFLPTDSPFVHQGAIESGFCSPLTWMARSSGSLPAGYYYPLVGKKFWTLGSGADCTLVFNDGLISSQHALLLATADRNIYFCDLQSVYGSFVNDRACHYPVLLRHGDRLKLGPLEVEFQYSGKVPFAELPEVQKGVLLVQIHENQGKIWQKILKTCGVSVIYKNFTDESFSENIEALLKSLNRKPDLMVVDMDTLKPNPYEFCRSCRAHYPNLKIILTCSNRTEVFPSERRWVKQQGAVDLLPGFSQESFFSLSLTDVVTRVECLLQALELPTSALSSLEPVLRSLTQRRDPPAEIP